MQRPTVPPGWRAITLALAMVPQLAAAVSAGGEVSLTSSYIYRGISESEGHGAVQVDLHATSDAGAFAGVFSSTLTRWEGHDPAYELELYAGRRFNLSSSWNVTLTAVNYGYLHGGTPLSNDFQELVASLSYLDTWTFSFSATPNAVRYADGYRLGRYPAYVADASAQVPLAGRLFLTAGAGYYSLTGPESSGYGYGNVGFAFEYRSLRLDLGYFAVQPRAQYLFPYGRADNRIAGTASWHF